MGNEETKTVLPLPEGVHEEATVFEPREFFNTAITGVENGRLVYNEDDVVLAITEWLQCTWSEAVEWYEYNTVRTLPYMGDYAPIIRHEEYSDTEEQDTEDLVPATSEDE